MGPKKGRRVRKIKIKTDSIPEFELEDTVADIQWRREEREGEEAQKQREETRRGETSHSPEEGVSETCVRTDTSDTEMDTCTEGGGEVGTSQSHSRHKTGHMTTRSCMTRLMNILRPKQGRIVTGRGLPTFASCLSRCARPGLRHKGYIMASSHNQSLERPQKCMISDCMSLEYHKGYIT